MLCKIKIPPVATASSRQNESLLLSDHPKMAAPPLSLDADPFTSIFSNKSSRLSDDTVCYAIFPDSSLSSSTSAADLSLHLQALRLDILSAVSQFTATYIWQHEPFSLSLSSSSTAAPLHLEGSLRYGDNLEDEWFVVFLLFHISRQFPDLSVRVWDTDGEFLLIEAAFHLPRWINPNTSLNRVFIRRGDIHIVPKQKVASPTISDSLKFLIGNENESRASEAVQSSIKSRIADYPDRARRNMHTVRVRVPVAVAQVLRQEPCLISVAVEGFYDRDIDTMKFAAKMEKFLPKGKEEEIVATAVTMPRTMYAQLVQQTFQPPKCYPMMPSRIGDAKAFAEAELGMKMACGFEMAYQSRKKEGPEGRGSGWEKYKETLEKIGYFDGLLPGSKDYKRLMEKAEECYKKSSVFSKTSETLGAPARGIDEILALPHSAEDFTSKEIPPSDDDCWLYNGEDELNSALQERQMEMDHYDVKHKRKQNMKEEASNSGPSSSSANDDYNLGDIAKSMQAFVHKVSSYRGAEVPENSDMKEVNLDVDQFMKDMESVMRHQGTEEASSDADTDEEGLSDMDFDESEEESDEEEEEKDTFMSSYSDAMSKELKASTLDKSFVRANEQPSKTNEVASSSGKQEMDDEDFSPVDVDVNLVKSLLDSFSSQEGLPGPASNLLGLMGVHLPSNSKGKGK